MVPAQTKVYTTREGNCRRSPHICLVQSPHKVQLALYDAFTVSQLETDAKKQLEIGFYLFKKATLK